MAAAAAGRSSRGASAAASPPLSHSHIKSGSRQSDRLPQEMTPVTEGSAANLQASFCLNSLSPCRQILIFSVTASLAAPPPSLLPPSPLSLPPHNIPPALAHKAHMLPDTSLPTYLAKQHCIFVVVLSFRSSKYRSHLLFFFSAVFFGGGWRGSVVQND